MTLSNLIASNSRVASALNRTSPIYGSPSRRKVNHLLWREVSTHKQ